jgi:hypothetical protein
VGSLVELPVDQREQPVQRATVAVAVGREQAGYVGIGRQEVPLWTGGKVERMAPAPG